MQRIDWDEAYRSKMYQEHWGIPYPSQELVAFVAAYSFAPGATALDIGCGAGQESIFLAQQGFQVIGIDMSKEALKIARQKAEEAGVQVDWRQENALQLPCSDASVDLINDRGCFHVIESQQRPQYVQEVARVLKPGGRMLLRGCREEDTDPFVAITPKVIEELFADSFTYGPVLPIELSAGAGVNFTLPANLVILQRR